jgi:glycerophosphoryl diester phosphodiesterase
MKIKTVVCNTLWLLCLDIMCFFILNGCYSWNDSELANDTTKVSWYSSNRLIAHALGGIEGNIYTNSLEALEYNYEAGHRVFEIDLSVTSDNVVVAAHDWETFSVLTGFEGIPSYEQFKLQLIDSKYHTLSLSDVVDFMERHSDMYMVCDKLQQNTEIIASAIVEDTKKTPGLIDRFIIEVGTNENFVAIDSCYHFENYIYALASGRGNYDTEENVEFCLTHSIPVVSMWGDWATTEKCSSYNKNNIKVYAHSINSLDDVNKLLNNGVYGFYTDYLKPGDIISFK